MGIKERQERDREAVRRAILDAARDLFVTEGYQHVSIRKIAERIEYSPAAIYSYFPSKDDIFFALAEEGFRLLGDPAAFDAVSTPEPLDHIRAIFWSFYEFSRNHPEYFTLMFVDRSVPRIIREYERFTFVRDMKRNIIEHLQRCIDAKSIPATVDPSIAFHLLAVGVTGVANMRLSDRVPREIADALARDTINVVIAGLQSGICLQSTAVGAAGTDIGEPAAAPIGVTR
jgi:AcrR family transcriptional regulator